MRLSEVLRAVGDRTLIARSPITVDPDVREVVLDDGVTALAPLQVVLAVRPGQESALAQRCVESGCQVLVVGRNVVLDPVPTELVIVEAGTGWTQLFVLIRTMLLASHDEAAGDDLETTPSSVHGLADAIAVMVGGTVVLYDRAHRVVAYSVQGQPIDDVRRDAILGRRTPDQWIRRFTIDRTAYQTYTEPGTVVTVADYPDLRKRLRIAVHAGSEVIGEISVAEGNEPFAPDAELALQRAARLAVPAMLRHRLLGDVDELARGRAVKGMLCEGQVPHNEHPCTTAFAEANTMSIVALGVLDATARESGADQVLAERLLHFLTLHVRSLSPAAQVVYLQGIFFAVIPDPAGSFADLARLAGVVLRQLDGMKVIANVALSDPLTSLADLPAGKRRVEDLLSIAQSAGKQGEVLSTDSHWAELILLTATRSMIRADVPRLPLTVLEDYDREHGAELVETLRVYLAAFGSVSAAAAQLYLHNNTLRHRLGRIREISGIDFEDASCRLALSLLLASESGALPATKSSDREPKTRA